MNNSEFSISLPEPVRCNCDKGWLLPLLRPVVLRGTGMQLGQEFWGKQYEVKWKCETCGKLVQVEDPNTKS